MDQNTRRDVSMEPQGYLGNSRVILNHFDAATQADIQHTALSYESEDETMGRSRGRQRGGGCGGGGTPHYSKQDIREQYCISERGLGALEAPRAAGGLFGCLAGAPATSPCAAAAAAAARSSLLTVCVRRRVPSDENLYELCRRQPADYAPMPRYPRYPWGAAPAEVYRYDEELECSYFRRRPRSLCGGPDPSRYTWLPADEEATRMERPRPIRADLDHRHSAEHLGYLPPLCPAHPPPLPPLPPPALHTAMHDQAHIIHRPKHVSFARSHTLTSFDDAVVSIAATPCAGGAAGGAVGAAVPGGGVPGGGARLGRSQERLLDGRKTCDPPPPITRQPEPCEPPRLLVEKLKRAPMKTQATQTEVCLGRKPLPCAPLTLSPRTIHRVKMVSQGAQTNGVLLLNGRKLMKSYSEAGGKFGGGVSGSEEVETGVGVDHEPLQRTQSEEPPRSPFLVHTPSPEPVSEPVALAPLPPPPSPPPVVHPPPATPAAPANEDSASPVTRSDLESEDSESKSQKEIIIDFEPQLPSSPVRKKPLLKTSSDGEILVDRRRAHRQPTVDKTLASVSHDNISVEPEPPRPFTPYFQNSPIRHEDIFKDLNDGRSHPIFSSTENEPEVAATALRVQDSLDEEFHENLIYGGLFRGRGRSSSTSELEPETTADLDADAELEDGVVPSLHLRPDQRASPFASSDSLTNDLRDHSDGIWNESQATVLQADSGPENGAAGPAAAALGVGPPPGAGALLTPSSRRKHLLLLQHQQRSSMDTDALDEESGGEQLGLALPPATLPPAPSIALVPPPGGSGGEVGPPSRRPPASPARARRTPEPGSPTTAPELLLARTDSGRTNTDVSESTTTDDYCTANSGTDSSRRSGSFRAHAAHAHAAPDGSSFESASSVYGPAPVPGAGAGDDMVVPCVSLSPPPAPIPEEASASDAAATPVPRSRSASSSSSGSYSLGGSCPELPRAPRAPRAPRTAPHPHPRPPVPSPRHVPSVSDDERSMHYSSSTYYESPIDDDSGSRAARSNGEQREWTDEEKRRRKKGFVLEVGGKQPAAADLSPGAGAGGDKPRRGKGRTRSPMQGRRAGCNTVNAPKRSPAATQGPVNEPEEATGGSEEAAGGATSDESSSGRGGEGPGGVVPASPRKGRKVRELGRRKSTPRSPPGARGRRAAADERPQPASLPGSLPRRRTQLASEDAAAAAAAGASATAKGAAARLSPFRSPGGSPGRRRGSQALSAESLRSVSPGSDSVFYSEASSHAGAAHHSAAEHHVHCLHCGKEVDIVTTDDPDKSASASSNGHADIVQPPAGFADSPRAKHGRLYKKLEKRFRSEERAHAERRHHKYRPDARAKSEERGASGGGGEPAPSGAAQRLRPLARAAGSSPSVLAGSPDAEDECGVYDEPYAAATWIQIAAADQTPGGAEAAEAARRDSAASTASTDSEHEFRKRYQSITHRMVHRKSCLEMYRRQASKSFESDKTVVVRRESGEFGFRIHGSKPVVVSAIEPDTPAESSGLEVGDIVLAVNGVSVLDKSHSEVVKIAHAGSDTLTLDVARTSGVLSPPATAGPDSAALYAGYLWKQGGHVSGNPSNKWVRRWFSLKKDNCLYSYKTDQDTQPVGAMMLLEHEVSRVEDGAAGAAARPWRLRVRGGGGDGDAGAPLHLAADSEAGAARWLAVLQRAAERARLADSWLELARRRLALPPASLAHPDCFGYLNKLGSKWKTWTRRYCVLKDACLYFYPDANALTAFGMACLHGYRVQQSAAGGKKHAFEVLPADAAHKHFYFHTESEMDRKRWLAALEYSIDRWLKVG